MGTFGAEIRFKNGEVQTKTPGVGDYDLTNFKNFAKVSETVFEIPKYKKASNRKLDRHSRAKSAINRTIENLSTAGISNDQMNQIYQQRDMRDMNTIFSHTESKQLKTSRSRSPAAMMGIQIGKRIGGPTQANQNFMMQVSRDARKRLYARETESA